MDERVIQGCLEADPFSYKKCPENIQYNYRGKTIPKCDFNKVAKQLY